ncbi:MAG: hypothetical protein HYY06_10785 [Deltaproteobacteria bacterium]|nr:hypothetical protein [Deltaproteobacteria bacterium]
MNRWLFFGAGILVGVVAARYLLQRPQGRRAAKRVISAGFAVGDWVATQVESLREDLSDLVAEAREERTRAASADAN